MFGPLGHSPCLTSIVGKKKKKKNLKRFMSMINFIYFPCKKASLNYKVILMDVQTEFVNQKI